MTLPHHAHAEQAQIPAAAVGQRRRATLVLVSTLVALGTLALTAAPAFAERTFVSQISGFVNPTGIAVDSADHVWVSDTGENGLISEYSAYPSQTLLDQQNGGGHFGCGGFYIFSLAVDSSNGNLYTGDSCADVVEDFEPSGAFVPPRWGGFVTSSSFAHVYVATDISGGPSSGRVYVSVSEPGTYPYGGIIKAFDPNHNEVNFEASEPYISGSEITGTPSGSFENLALVRVAVDANGDIYVVDQAREVVDEFESSGKFVREFTGAGVPGGSFGQLTGVAVDPTNEDVLIVDSNKDVVDEFSPSDKYLGQLTGTSSSVPFGELSGGIAVNSNGYVYVVDHFRGVVDTFSPKTVLPKITYETPTNPTPTSETVEANIDPNGGGPVTECHIEYGTDRAYSLGSVPCSSEHFSALTTVTAAFTGLTSETTYHYRVVVSNANGTSNGQDHTFTPHWVPNLTTEAATDLTNTSATLEGSFIGNGDPTEYYFQYGTDTGYGETTTVEDGGSPNGLTHLSTPITGLQPLVTYHYRVVATNTLGTTYGQDRTFTTLTEPSIGGLSSSNVTSTTAVLHATINPQGADTRYHFEYGPTTSYGGSATGSEGEITDNLFTEHAVEVQLKNLQAGVTYHFRVVAENPYGTPASEDQTFGFHPPNCPNSHLRQVTHSSSLPDCRAYELVSPSDAGNSTLYAQGPNSPVASNPSRFAFGGVLGAIPGTGDPPDTAKGDLYVATRTDQGWVTKYVGIPGSETYSTNGPPDESRNTSDEWSAGPAGVRTDTGMDRFIDWNDGIPWDKQGPKLAPAEFAPHVWAADGNALEEWPNLPGHAGSEIDPIFEQSADFTHFVFQTGSAPSLSLIDDNTVAHTATEVSIAPGEGPIPIQPGDTTPDQESLRVPAVSTNGSHILIAARAEPQEHPMVRNGYGEDEEPCGLEKTEQEIGNGRIDQICPLQPSQLYMRIGDAVTYEIAPGHAVRYLGETPDGSRVYFTSEEHLTGEDEGHGGASLYMWSQQGEDENPPHPLTLISKANPGSPPSAGDTAACTAAWTTQCGIAPFANNSFSDPPTEGYLGGNGLSDNFIAAENGDIYFFSPEQLAGPRGVKGQENLYDYRNGTLQYVATFAPQPFCNTESFAGRCSAGPVIRMQVSPNDTHMAFLTADRVTSYNNAGYTEMYTYDPSTKEIRCVSCLPSGAPPTTNVFASSNGLFMTNDGRTFFSTGDPLVPQDTDGLIDVYEFVEGHAQLISSGTSAVDEGPVAFAAPPALSIAGLAGVSADGTDVYFSTFDTLVGQDRNGSQLKFYDARTDGGFPYSPPPAPCEAADECHGPGSPSEAPFRSGSGAELGTGGNFTPDSSVSHHKHEKRHHKSKHRKRHTGRRHG